MTFSASDVIAIISVLVASLSAVYSRWAVNATKHQNEISLHAERLIVFKGVVTFYSKLASNSALIKEEDVWLFHDSVELSEFYYSKSIYQRLKISFSNALSLMEKVDGCNEAREFGTGNSYAKSLNSEKHKLMREIRDECLLITKEMKVALRIAKA